MEILDIVDENGVPTGRTVDRETAHKDGIRHRTSHVWVARLGADYVRHKNNGQPDESGDAARRMLAGVELLLQRRSPDKDSHPGRLDISSAGHIPAGCGYIESALRELEEELGITAAASELHFCGKRRKAYRKRFHDTLFSDNQVSNVYVMLRDIPASEIVYQQSEISSVCWMPFNEVYDMVARDEEYNRRCETETADADRNRPDCGDMPRSCIAFEEMQLLRNYLCDHLDVLTGTLA